MREISNMHMALYQPDIPQNVGGSLRLSACLGVGLHIIEPCGFVMDDKRIRRAGMDYMQQATVQKHPSWDAFCQWRHNQNPTPRLVLLTTKASTPLPDFAFAAGDILLAGRESAGVPDEVAETADARVRIPMCEGARSLNVTVSLGMVLCEALRQTNGFPDNVQREASNSS